MHQLTPAQNSKIAKQEERRRRELRQREDEYRRRIERLRRQIEEARRRRQRLMLLLLPAILARQESILAAFQRSFVDWSDPDPEPKDWTPDPRNDFAAQPGHDDNCDGYSRKEWTRMLDERGIKLSRKAEIKAAWEADPDHELFPPAIEIGAIAHSWGSLAAPYSLEAAETEIRWQLAQMTADVRAALRSLPPVGSSRARPPRIR